MQKCVLNVEWMLVDGPCWGGSGAGSPHCLLLVKHVPLSHCIHLTLFFFLAFIYLSMFFQDSSAPSPVVVFNLVVEDVAHLPMWESNWRPWYSEHCTLTNWATRPPQWFFLEQLNLVVEFWEITFVINIILDNMNLDSKNLMTTVYRVTFESLEV